MSHLIDRLKVNNLAYPEQVTRLVSISCQFARWMFKVEVSDELFMQHSRSSSSMLGAIMERSRGMSKCDLFGLYSFIVATLKRFGFV